jgi:hypothetical protein
MVAIVAQSWNDTKKLVVLEMVMLELVTVVVLTLSKPAPDWSDTHRQKSRNFGHAQPVLWMPPVSSSVHWSPAASDRLRT